MDPVVPFIVTLVVLTGGGAGGAAYVYRRWRRHRLEELLRDDREHGGSRVSVFDVFWDLGANELALELMRHENLLPKPSEDRRVVHERLETAIAAHDGYATFVREMVEIIEEFANARREADTRRNIPKLEVRGKKLLDVDGEEGEPTLEVDALEPVGEGGGVGSVAGASLEDRMAYRRQRRDPGRRAPRMSTGDGAMLDVDAIESMSIQEIVGSVVEGRFTETLRDWWEGRRARKLKDQLDEAFGNLYDFYVREAERRDAFYDDLFATADRWQEEASRIEALRESRPLEGASTALAADILLEVAAETARSIARNAEINTRSTIEEIHARARQGDVAMAGYLVYLNRNAFFAGRSPEYGDYVRRIENLAHRLEREVRSLQ